MPPKAKILNQVKQVTRQQKERSLNPSVKPSKTGPQFEWGAPKPGFEELAAAAAVKRAEEKAKDGENEVPTSRVTRAKADGKTVHYRSFTWERTTYRVGDFAVSKGALNDELVHIVDAFEDPHGNRMIKIRWCYLVRFNSIQNPHSRQKVKIDDADDVSA